MFKLLGIIVTVSLVLSMQVEAATNYFTLNVPSQYPTISAAVNAANQDNNSTDYYIINTQPGTYTNDFPTVNRPMTIQADPTIPGMAVLSATIPLPNQKGIILNNSNLTIIRLRLTGAQIDNSLGGNGAGIRDQNTSANAHLDVISSVFDNNQEGILTGFNPSQVVRISWSKFKNNGNPDPNWWQHGIYIGHSKSLSVSNSLFCGQLIGHNIKSRASATSVTNTRIYDGIESAGDNCRAGSSSYAIDTPNGGNTSLSGNTILQGTSTQNNTVVAYGEEGMVYPTNSMVVQNNSFITYQPNTVMIFIPNCPVPVQGLNTNSFTGITTDVGQLVVPAGCSN